MVANPFSVKDDVADFIGSCGDFEIGFVPMYNMECGMGRTTVAIAEVLRNIKV